VTSDDALSDEILTVAELAQLLKVAERTVYTMAQNAEIPCFKVRGQWRFRKHDIDAWITEFVDSHHRNRPAGRNKRLSESDVYEERGQCSTSVPPESAGASPSPLRTEGHRPQTRRPS
jgi:excisionase family DNA binding protein